MALFKRKGKAKPMKKSKSDKGLRLPSPPLYPALEMKSIKGDISQDILLINCYISF